MPHPTKSDFLLAIQELKNLSRSQALEYIEILSSDLHKKLGHYSGTNHRMASCSDAMYDSMVEHKGDEVITKPPKGRGATLKIRYYL